MNDNRKDRRIYAPEVLPVKDKASHLTLGFLRDLSVHGMKLTGRGPFKDGQKYNLSIVLPRAVMGARTIQLEATCKWKAKTQKRDIFDAGFQFGRLTEDQELMVVLVQVEYAVKALDFETVVEHSTLGSKG